ncbi:hypothetical protein MUK42_03758 [Musa troglodytarum]|uniref:Uncharacterized protein n=1 Tax=Musa troglodytarum TaxID=320322 RepID=A0A9E7KEM6_9LILI|nr:hypothetical protein MUK42_03758 [Musa troglodytarum]
MSDASILATLTSLLLWMTPSFIFIKTQNIKEVNISANIASTTMSSAATFVVLHG